MASYALIGDSQAVGLHRALTVAMTLRGYADVGSSTHVGWSTRRIADSLEAISLSRVRPDIVFVVLGGNDTPGDPLDQAIATLIGQIRQFSSPYIIWIGPASAEDPEIQARKSRVAIQQYQMARRLGFQWLDGQMMTADLEHRPDGIHFPASELEVWADRIITATFSQTRGAWPLWFGSVGLLGASAWIGWRATR